MSTPDPNAVAASTATAAAASTTPAATSTKKPASLKAVTGFGSLDPNVLVNTAHVVAGGIGGYPQYFADPPVAPSALDASATALYNAILSALDGGKTAKLVREQQRKLVVQDLNLLAVYVQNVSNDDPVIFAASGFAAKPTGKSAPQPVAVPSFRWLDYGSAGQLVVFVKAVTGAKSYVIRYAVMTGTTPGPWSTLPAAMVRKPITLSGLTPGSVYGFQVQALGVLGYSDWSATETIICPVN